MVKKLSVFSAVYYFKRIGKELFKKILKIKRIKTMIILPSKEHLQRRIKEVTNRIQLLTESAEDKKTREVLIFSLRELQREYQVYI